MLSSSDNAIFVVGAMSSGTTYLRRLINAHSEIYISQEFDLIGQRTNVKEMLFQLASSDEFGDIPVDQCLGWADDIARSYINMLATSELERLGKRRYGDKTPRNSNFMMELGEMFPNAVFIHIIRDGRAVAAFSLERQRLDPRFIDQDWAPKTSEAAAQSWVNAIETVRNSGSRYHSSRYLEIRYEDFLDRRHETVEDIFFFLNERPDDGVFRVRDEFFDAPKNWTKTIEKKDLDQFMSVEPAVALLKKCGYH